jgi:MFS family permease
MSREFAAGWRTVTGAALGVGLGISGLLTYNSGLFVEGLGRDVGLTRTIYGAAFLGSTLALAIAMPVVARSVDAQGPRRTAAFGAVALAVGFLALSQVRSVVGYVAAMIGIGLLAGLSSPVPFTRAVAASFERSRGLALGLTQAGIGIAAALVPPLIGIQIAEHGWRAGYLALAGLAALGVLPALLLLPGHQNQRRNDAVVSAEAFTAIRGSRTYMLQLAAFTTMALAFAGMLAHFVPMLLDSGMPVQRAGATAGLIGISVIVTRVIVGWLADRVEPAWLGAASCAVCAAGCLLLALGGTGQAPLGAIALGAAMGAEADLIGILTARYFSLAAFSRAYARQYAAFMVAGGLSPLWIGYLADVTGDYKGSLYVCTAGLLLPIVLFARLAMLSRDAGGRALDQGARNARTDEQTNDALGNSPAWSRDGAS